MNKRTVVMTLVEKEEPEQRVIIVKIIHKEAKELEMKI